MTERLPMFPLGSVLVPHMLLPLRIFEPRYLEMLEAIGGEGGEFGVVLIERGTEVGGGDQRFAVGSVARILEVSEPEDGQRLLLAAGTVRVRVVEWLEDDPYPQAVVERLADPAPAANLTDALGELDRKLRRVFGLMAEMGVDVGVFDVDLAPDAVTAGYQGMVLAPIATLDRQQLLELDSVDERLRRVLVLLDEQMAVLEQQLAAG